MVILADEPTGNLDPQQSHAILSLFRQIHAQGTTIVLATHDSSLVDALQTRVIRLEGGRVIRDSVGGYEQTAPRAKHKIFKEEHSPENDVPVTSAVERKSTKKVRITSIGS